MEIIITVKSLLHHVPLSKHNVLWEAELLFPDRCDLFCANGSGM